MNVKVYQIQGLDVMMERGEWHEFAVSPRAAVTNWIQDHIAEDPKVGFIGNLTMVSGRVTGAISGAWAGCPLRGWEASTPERSEWLLDYLTVNFKPWVQMTGRIRPAWHWRQFCKGTPEYKAAQVAA